MRITSTISNIRSDDIPVVLVNLDGTRKFLPRPETYKDMQRLVRAHYAVDDRAGLHFHVSTWDVCAGENVEITELAFALLAPLLDTISVVVVHPELVAGRDRVIPTPEATPPLDADEQEDDDDEYEVYPRSEPAKAGQSRTPTTPSRRANSESDTSAATEESSVLNFSDTHSEDEEAKDAEPVTVTARLHKEPTRATASPAAPQTTPRKLFQPVQVQAKEEIKRTPNSKRNAPGRAAASPRQRAAAASRQPPPPAPSSSSSAAADIRFKVHVQGPRPGDKAEFMTRGRYFVHKVLSKICETFGMDVGTATLMLCVPMPCEDGKTELVHFECDRGETLAQAGVGPGARLVVKVMPGGKREEGVDEIYESE